MKKLTLTIVRLLCLATLLAPWTLVQALDGFKEAGQISSTEYEKITIKGKSYRPAPGIAVYSDDPARSTFATFQKGDVVYVEGKTVGGVRYIDIIRYQEPDDH